MIIAISGTPGTGKTTLAKKLMKELGYPLLDVKKFIKEKKLVESYDQKRKSDIIDIKKLNKELVKEIKSIQKEYNPQGIIIDSHLSHYLLKSQLDLVIITKTNLKVLERRLKKRKYSKAKIRENLDSEIFDICNVEAQEKGHKTLVVDTTKGIKVKEIIKKINKKQAFSRFIQKKT